MKTKCNTGEQCDYKRPNQSWANFFLAKTLLRGKLEKEQQQKLIVFLFLAQL